MKPYFSTSIAIAMALTAFVPLARSAEVPCDKISNDVRTAVAKDPSKVLMVVEDALVINESCACEIVRAAILASSADAALTKQIVETAVAVAPKMTAVIQECAASTQVPGTVAAMDPTDSGKSVVSGKSPVSGKSGVGEVDENGNPFTVQPPKEGVTGEEDFSQGGRIDIRGVYLSQPAAGGFIVARNEPDSDSDGKKDLIRRRIIRERRVIVVPVSPTAPHPKS